MSTDTPLYHLCNLQKTYAGRTVLDISTLDIHQGELLAIVGPSGAGEIYPAPANPLFGAAYIRRDSIPWATDFVPHPTDPAP